jgi:DNA (cytosine-5)-methyltransferase 1
VKVGSLCAGYGGLEMALELLGVPVDLAWYAEIHPAASAVMAAHHPEVPNLGDLTQITNPPHVEMVTAGFPCQPLSSAGQRKGMADERWIIDDVCRVARESGAEWLILENVPGIVSGHTVLSHCGHCGTDCTAEHEFIYEEGEGPGDNEDGAVKIRAIVWGDCSACGRSLADGSRVDVRHWWFPAVLRALAVNGFDDAEWGTLAASAVGAPHRRLRWFCVARNAANQRRERGGEHGTGGLDLRTQVARLAADTHRVGREGRHDRGGASELDPCQRGPVDHTGPGESVNLLPTPAANQPGGSADQHLDRKARMPDGANRTTVTDLRMVLSLLPRPTTQSGVTGNQSTAKSPGATRQGDNLTDVAVKNTFGRYADAIARWEQVTGVPAPAPLDGDKLNPAFAEWMMGLPPGHVTDVPIARSKKLHVIGNGVVRQQGAAAIGELFGRHRSRP